MRKILLSMVFGLALAGCGSDDSDDVFRPPPGPVASQLSISSSAATMPSDNSAPVTITVLARDASNLVVPDVVVTFSATSGALIVSSPTTGANGDVSATLGTPGDTSLRTITVTASSGSLTASTLVQVVAPVASAPPSVSTASDTVVSSKTRAPASEVATFSAGAAGWLQDATAGTLITQPESFSVGTSCAAESLATTARSPDAPAAFIDSDGTGSLQILFADLNGNPLASGTTISAFVVGDGLSIGSPSNFTVPCTGEPTIYPLTIVKNGAVSTGSLQIVVTSPSGVPSVLSYPIN